MKIALLMRGPLRPTVASGLARVASWVVEIIEQGHTPTVFFATWSQPGNRALAELAESHFATNVLCVEEPAYADILEYCDGINILPGGRQTRNVFLQYYLSRLGIRMVMESGDFDYIIHARPDMDMRLGKHFDEWFVPGHYCTVHHRDEGGPFINDQIGVATPEVMWAAWDHGSRADLGRFISRSTIPEDVLQQMMDVSGVKGRKACFEVWRLDPDRNVAA